VARTIVDLPEPRHRAQWNGAALHLGSCAVVRSGHRVPPGPLHIDVDMKLWNKTHRPLTIFEPRRARAAGQSLEWEEPGYMGAFKEATLSPDGARVDEDFRVDPPGDDELVARAGDKLTVDLTRNRGRRLRIHLTVEDPTS
jgi:hypothetical protein